MENTYTLYVASKNEQWEMPDALALSWEQYETEHPLAPDGSDADNRHLAWFESLSGEQQKMITCHKPQP